MRRKTRPVHGARGFVRQTLGLGAHDLQQGARGAPAHRREGPGRAYTPRERSGFFAIQLEQLAQAPLQRVGRHQVAQAAPLPPGREHAQGQVEAARDAAAAQRLDARVGNIELQRQSARAGEESAIDLARLLEQAARVAVVRRAARGEQARGAVDGLRVLADLLGDIGFEQRLEGGERKAQRQRLAQPAQRAAVELPEQARVQAREDPRAVQRASGFTAR